LIKEKKATSVLGTKVAFFSLINVRSGFHCLHSNFSSYIDLRPAPRMPVQFSPFLFACV